MWLPLEIVFIFKGITRQKAKQAATMLVYQGFTVLSQGLLTGGIWQIAGECYSGRKLKGDKKRQKSNWTVDLTMGVDHRGTGGHVPQNLE